MVLADQETQETRRPVAARQQEASRLGSRRANHAVVHPGGCPVVALVVALVVSAARDGASRRRRALQSRRRQARQGRGDLSRARARDDQERRHFIDRVRAVFDRAALLVSGAKGRDERPQFDRLCRDATKRQFDAIMAWSVDRLGRSLQDLVKFLSEIHALKIDLYLHQQGLDTTTPAGKAMFQMIGVFAEFERAMIQERVRAGLARAKAEGKQLGRPKVDEVTETAIREALRRKNRPGILKIAKELGVGTSTVQRIAAEFGS